MRERKVARKVWGKKDASFEEEQLVSPVDEACAILQTVQGKGKSRLFDVERGKKSLLKKQNDFECGGVECAVSEAEGNPSKCKQKATSRTDKRHIEKRASSSAKHVVPLLLKRQRWKENIESDLSEEEETEVFNDHKCSYEVEEDLALTTEDLVKLATEHLETERIANDPGNNRSGDGASNDELQKNAVAGTKKKGSIFSVQGWNNLANQGSDARGASYSQELLQLAPTFLSDVSKHHTQGSTELDTDAPPLFGKPVKTMDSLKTAENVVDDMLGLIFGPILSKPVSFRLESSQNMVQAVNRSTLACPYNDMKDVVLPISKDSKPQLKKTSSLKDKVMMYLG